MYIIPNTYEAEYTWQIFYMTNASDDMHTGDIEMV